jgi:hypothetical protein
MTSASAASSSRSSTRGRCRAIGGRHLGGKEVAFQARQPVERHRHFLEALVFLQAPDQLRARVVLVLDFRLARQQHPRLDLGEHRRHHQVFGSQFETQCPHHGDVVDVLAGDLGDVDQQDVEVAAADQVEQQVERTLESLQHHLEGVRRDVQIGRELGDALAEHDGEGQLLLAGGGGIRLGLRFADAHGILQEAIAAIIENAGAAAQPQPKGAGSPAPRRSSSGTSPLRSITVVGSTAQ